MTGVQTCALPICVYKGRKSTIEASEVMELKEQGLGASAIAKQLGICRASVYRVIQ